MKPCKLAEFVFLVAFATTMRAEMQPSFSLETSSWFATHIVVVTEGDEIDGKVAVLESWKGDLKPRQIILVPELAAFRSKDSRRISTEFGATLEPPAYVTGERMLLFLTEKRPSRKAPEETVQDRSWAGANDGNMQVSVVWIEDGHPFAFQQQTIPGDSTLVSLAGAESENEIRNRVAEVTKTHASLDRALETNEPAARAKALEEFTTSELFLAQRAAFAGLQECGSAALPVLKTLLHDQARLSVHGDAIETMWKIGGDGVGEELTDVVRVEMAFWKTTAPHLRVGWWNAIEEPGTGKLREQYGRVYAALYGLQKLKFASCRPVVTEFRAFWRSWPQLEDNHGLSQISQSCDAVLSQLP